MWGVLVTKTPHQDSLVAFCEHLITPGGRWGVDNKFLLVSMYCCCCLLLPIDAGKWSLCGYSSHCYMHVFFIHAMPGPLLAKRKVKIKS